jgi:DNA-binding beta-propeller fold protein YncE
MIPLKKRNVYLTMTSIAILSAVLFTVISLLNLEGNVKPIIAAVDRSGPPEYAQAFYGDFNTPLSKPMDVARVGEFVYVSDTSNKQIQVFDQAGTPIFQFGEEGSEEGQFMFPYGISGDKAGDIYVADLYNGNISIFDSKGKFLHYFEEQNSEKAISSPGGLRIYDEKLYVTDIKANKLFIFTLDGKLEMEIGGAGAEDGKFIAPNAVTVDKEGQIYVTDSGNNRVQVFGKDGKFKKIINGSKDGTGSPLFLNPRGVAVDSKGIVYVVNNLSHNIYAYDQEGTQVHVLGGMGTENGTLYLPNGLFIDNRDTLYVTDTVNQRVAIYY